MSRVNVKDDKLLNHESCKQNVKKNKN